MSSTTEQRGDSVLFEQLSRGLLSSGHHVRFQARGRSMLPLIQDGENLRVESVPPKRLRVGDIVVAKTPRGLRAHRLIFKDLTRDCFLTRGDAGQESDPPISAQHIIGRVVLSTRSRLRAHLHFLTQRLIREGRRWRRSLTLFASALVLVASCTLLQAQVVFDSVTTGAARPNTAGNTNITFAHNTANVANRLLVVGVSMNISGNTGATVTGVTYNAVALTKLGIHNDAGNTRRVEIWYLVAPAVGNLNVIVSVNLPIAARVGVTAGAMTFTGVDQTLPLSAMVSNDGAAGNFSQLDIPSGTNQIVFDTLAAAATSAITKGPSQTQQWNLNSTNNGASDVQGFGSTNVGAASVPMSETFSAATNWSVAGASVQPLQADVGVTLVQNGAAMLGNNLTYTITVTNNGPTTATGVTLTDTLAAGLVLVSATPSQGSCSGTGPINCPLGSLAGGASATVTVVASAAAIGFYANTASVTATQPDLNTGNNSYTAVGVVQSNTCASPANLGNGGTLGGVVNTYYPATASVTAGTANTTIPVGTARGAVATIAAGDLLLVMQMQDASINSTNTASYGNGATGAGFTTINNAGNYEFVKATGPIAGSAIPIAGSGVNSGLIYSYTIAAATGTKGKSTFQVIRVPQYATASLSSTLTASAWDGTSGGVLVLDIAGALTLNSATVSVDGLGFRGAGALQLNGGVGGANTDYVHTSPATYTGTVTAGVDGGKGEGAAGTPLWVQSAGSFLSTGTDGYPNGGMARGAPANAGGGGTDGDQVVNQQNAGGGGAGNGGIGGSGGDSWQSTLGIGGLGGATFPSTLSRISLGGGGGGGSRNNSDGDNQASSGAAGGGLILIRAGSLTGTATLTANGATAYAGTLNDAGGGGGAGGTVVVLSAGGGEGGLTVQARGGVGGNSWTAQAFALNQRHGPGGGGGGGVVYLTGAGSISVTGGLNGITLNPGVAYGATAGSSGIAVTNAQIAQGSGTQSGAGCIPDMAISKSHAGSFVRGSAVTYSVVVSNVGTFGASTGLVTVNDTLPLGVVPSSASGAGWSCAVAQQTVSCIRADALAAAAVYPTITINGTVSQSAPNTVVNSATVSGGGELNLLNDTATDVAASVTSVSDLVVANSGSPNPVIAGNNITYTQTVTNSGPSDATGVTFVETIPANTLLQTITAPAGWVCSNPGQTGTIVCTNADLAPGTPAVFTIVVKVNVGTPNGTVITDTVSASSGVSDPTATNNSATVTTIVGTTAQADLSITNAASPNPVTVGNNITYTQVVTNTGSAAATTATYFDTVPANTTFQAYTFPVGWSCSTPIVGGTGNVTCTNPSVAAGSTGNFQLQVKVNVGVAGGTVITDTATVGAANDPNAGNNSATVTDVVATATQADVTLSTTTTPSGSVLSGDNLTYNQVITNNGPATATSLSFTEATPANTTFQSVIPPAGWTCVTPAVGATGTVTCTAVSLAAGSVANISMTVNVNAATANNTTLTATSSVTSATSDPNAANNTTTVNTTALAAVNLTVTNSGAPSPITAGANITYTQTVANKGPGNASTVSFSQTVPANSTFVSGTTPPGWTCTFPAVGGTGNINCTIPTLAPATTTNFQVVVKVNAGTPAGTIIADTATVTTTTRDTVPGDNSVTVNIAVGTAGQADLRVTNAGTPDPVTAGNNITYTQVATNGGPGTATAATFTGSTPANTTFVSLPTPAGWSCTTPAVGGTGAITCNIGSLANAATATFVLTVKVNSNTPVGTLITDTAAINSIITPDPNPGNNSASSTVAVGTSADLSITNSDTPDPVIAGNNITYTQVLTNPGPSNAANVTFSETIPANTNFQTFTPPVGWACNTIPVGGTGTLTCTIASLAPGTTNFPAAVQVNAGTAAGTTITDTVSVSSSTDTNTANNTATTTTTVATAGQADLAVTNTPSASSVPAGSNITYTQTVTNNGPAASNTLTFTETIPANTTFQSIAAGAWACSTPAVGGTGTVSCTLATLAAAASSPISLVVQVNASTPSGTVISDTASVSAATSDPNGSNNSATATVTVGTGTSADVSITKSASPSPVNQGNLLTYTLIVTNNGPASATNVTAVDVLPSSLKFISATTNVGSCSQAANTVTCQLLTMANAATATISIVVTPLSSTVVTNSAMVTADQTDGTAGNNVASATTLVTAPTGIHLQSLTAEATSQGVVMRWKTAGELNNLGFNVYREQDGERVRLNPTLVAGSALMMRGYLEKHAGKSYVWIDPSASPGSSYWLEDVDLNGERTFHGPVTASLTGFSARAVASPTMSEFASRTATAAPASRVVENAQRLGAPAPGQSDLQFDLAAHFAVKIMVDHEGWYRVTQPELVAAGWSGNADASKLRLFAEAVEQPILVTGADNGQFGSMAAIEFYATGMDTPFTGTRAYWLIAGDQAGLRVGSFNELPSGSNYPQQITQTVELRQRSTYFAALINSADNNFFGALVSSTPIDQAIATPHVSASGNSSPRFELVLQGVGDGVPHNVKVALNGLDLGRIAFSGQTQGKLVVNLAPGLLLDSNTVTLTAQDGDSDISLVDHITITYPRSVAADDDHLRLTTRAGTPLQIANFQETTVRVFDITAATKPVELATRMVSGGDGSYAVQVQVPFSPSGKHTLLALGASQIAKAAQLVANQPSQWHSPQAGAQVVVIAHPSLADGIAPLADLRRQQGRTVSVVLTDDIYDEFSFGERNPQAIRDFLQTATKNWTTKPKYLLLTGDASIDPRNFLGFGDFDFVPTRIIPTAGLMTASDDWYSDFNNTGLPSLATGRLPVRTAGDLSTVVSKIINYETGNDSGSWTGQALLVADRNDTADFTADTQKIAALLPPSIQATQIITSNLDPDTARAEVQNALNAGQLLVNYLGHGSVQVWSGDTLLDDTSAAALTNGSRLPVFLTFDCLNGFFQDVYTQSLSEALLLNSQGGAVAVISSSALTDAQPQALLDRKLVQALMQNIAPTLGDAFVQAKSGIKAKDVRKTYLLFGDPLLKLKTPAPRN
ncbi:MAG: DUF11 domain-containing protein [Acidobacteria bacterium]|nr:DUF11 domain-containing protein [Acidobacteriota bacterium]